MKKNHEKGKEFIKTGLIALSGILLVALGFFYLPDAAATMSNSSSSKKLPIYCVDRSDNKIAISFDAAWGNVALLEKKTDTSVKQAVFFGHILATEPLIHPRNYKLS